jgi:hypothetical protein
VRLKIPPQFQASWQHYGKILGLPRPTLLSS